MTVSIGKTRCRLKLATRSLATTIFASSALSTRALSGQAVPKYTSCASPKFDVFSAKLTGDWQWNSSQEADSIIVEEVEEVMRSCGGAVQGMRELPSLTFATDETEDGDEGGYYLNRANDGFIYFDGDGSYSCGPVQASNDGPWISNLSFGASRLLLSNDVSRELCERLHVFRKSGEPVAGPTDPLLQELPGNIVWQEIVRCRMPSPTQPWMMQRLKWERCSFGDSGDDEEGGEPAEIHQTWAYEVSSADDPVIKTLLEDTGNSVVWSAGGMCSRTGMVKTVLRQYSGTNGSLQSVACAQGRIRHPEK